MRSDNSLHARVRRLYKRGWGYAMIASKLNISKELVEVIVRDIRKERKHAAHD